MEQLEFTATENEAGVRIDRCLSDKYEELSRSYLQKLLKEQGVTVNGKAVKANYKIQAGDLVQTTLPDLTEPDILPENIPLDILYEDDDVLVINKPKGMVVHPANGHTSGTLVNAIMYHCQGNLSGINGVMRPGIVHRIDKDTTGALLVCKNDTAHRDLAQQLKAHTIKRRYRAIVAGNLKEDEGTVEGPIGRHPIDRKKMAINYKNGKDANGKSSAFSGRKKHLCVSTFTSGLISSIRSFITSVLYFPTVFRVAMIWRFRFVRHTLSSSIRSKAPTPLLTNASHTYPPTPPIPNTATLAPASFFIPSSPRRSWVLEN